MTPVQPKLIYLTRRAPMLDRAGFTTRWRQHAALGMSRLRWRNIARYVHCDLCEPEAHERAWLADHDGIGMIWHRSPEHRAAHLADVGSRHTMEEDEALTFARPIADVAIVCAETILIAPRVDPSAVKLVVFSSDQPADPPAAAIGHVRNLPLPPENEAGWGLACAAVDEFWFADRATARAAGRLLARPERIIVMGRDVTLY